MIAIKKYLSKFPYMGSTSSRSSATENMKQIKELDIHEKTRTDIYCNLIP